MSEGVVGRNEILSLQFCIDIFLLSLTAKRSCDVALCQWKMSFPLEEDSENKEKKGYLVRLPETDTDNNGVDEKSRDDDYSIIAPTCIFSSSKPERLEMGASLT